MKNVVIGVSVNFNANDLKNFILSFREVNTIDDIVLFVDINNIQQLKESFKDYNVIFKTYHFHEFVDTPVHNSRYVKYLEFLSDHSNYKNVFLSDTKDVIFQHNPFDNLPDNYLYFFKEDSGITIGNDYFFNSWWIYSAYGVEVLTQLGNNNIICSGTILGSYNELLKLLLKVKEEFTRIKTENTNVFKTTILDQAIINYIGYFNAVEDANISIKSNGDIVATLGASLGSKVTLPANFDLNSVPSRFLEIPPPADEILINGYHLMVNRLVPSIIHQYDRSPVLKETFNKKYQL